MSAGLARRVGCSWCREDGEVGARNAATTEPLPRAAERGLTLGVEIGTVHAFAGVNRRD